MKRFVTSWYIRLPVASPSSAFHCEVDLEGALRVGALGGFLVEEARARVELRVVAVARRQLDDRERDVAAEDEELLEQVARHECADRGAASRRAGAPTTPTAPHEGALPVPHLDEFQELEALQRLAHDGGSRRAPRRARARWGIGAGPDRAREDLRAELLEDLIGALPGNQGLELEGHRGSPSIEVGGVAPTSSVGHRRSEVRP